MGRVPYKEIPMRVPDSSFLSTILSATETPCVSIYLPAHRANGNAHGSLTDQENHGRFRNLADRVEEVLTKTHPGGCNEHRQATAQVPRRRGLLGPRAGWRRGSRFARALRCIHVTANRAGIRQSRRIVLREAPLTICPIGRTIPRTGGVA